MGQRLSTYLVSIFALLAVILALFFWAGASSFDARNEERDRPAAQPKDDKPGGVHADPSQGSTEDELKYRSGEQK